MNQSITIYRISLFKKITAKFTTPLPQQFRAMGGQFVFFLRQKHPYIAKLAIFLLMLLLAFLLTFIPPLF